MGVRKQIIYLCHDESNAAYTIKPTGVHCAAGLEARGASKVLANVQCGLQREASIARVAECEGVLPEGYVFPLDMFKYTGIKHRSLWTHVKQNLRVTPYVLVTLLASERAMSSMIASEQRRTPAGY